MIEPGANKWFGTLVYCITELVRQTVEALPKKKTKPKTKHKLQPLPPRIGIPMEGFDR